MKRVLRSGFAAAGRSDAVWQCFKGLKFVAACLAEPWHQADMARRRAREADTARRLSPSLKVLHGPFEGMRYARPEAAGSALVPKLLGSYERELHPTIEQWLTQEFSDLVDVGCAEGWYAVGMARRLPDLRVHAFDTDAVARGLCVEMAGVNGVTDRVTVQAHCDPQVLLALVSTLGPRALIVSDCEGYEATLFTPEVAHALAAHDLLIEVHDRDDPALGHRLRRTFAATHHASIVDSIDDTRKLRSYDFAELDGLDELTRRDLLGEGRCMTMEWLILRSRQWVAMSQRPVVARLDA
jgi:hypothetical protein